MVTLVVTELIALVLIVAGAGKLVVSVEARELLSLLHVPRRAVATAVRFAATAEWGLGVLLILQPRSLIVWIAVLGMFGVFALVGLWAIITGSRIRCGCFGFSTEKLEIGWMQVLQLLAILCGFLLSQALASVALSTQERLLLLSLTHGVAAGIFLALSAPRWHSVRTQIRSLGPAGAPPDVHIQEARG